MAKQNNQVEAVGPAFDVVWLDPATLQPNPENPKVHPQRQREALRASLAEFGWLAAPVWNKRTGRLVDGHARVEDALANGVVGGRIPVRVIDVDEATERRILVSLDRVGELRRYDDEALAALLAACSAGDDVLPGWSDDEVAELLRAAEAVPAPPARDREPAAGGEAAEGGSGGGAEVGEVRPVASVRMVQLFYGPDEHAEFEAAVGALAERWALNSPSDVVLWAMRECGASDAGGAEEAQ